MRILTILLLIFLCIACSPASEMNKIIGVKIYEYEGDAGELVSQWVDMGINTAFVSTTLAADTAFRQVLKQNNIAVFVIFPVFQDPEALKSDSTLFAITDKGARAKDDWVEFVCPSRTAFRRQKVSAMAQLIRDTDPEGVSLDFIRQFVFWEMVYPDRAAESIDRACFCDSCLTGFTAMYDYHIPDTCTTTPQKAGFVLSHYAVAYNDYRTGLIASMVKELALQAKALKPTIRINVHAVPWRNGDFGDANTAVAGQDLKKIAPFADYISPMCYSQMLKRDARWITSVVSAMNRSAPGKILPSIQVYPYYIDTPFDADDFRKCVKAALSDSSMGVVFWSWPLFEKDPERKKFQ